MSSTMTELSPQPSAELQRSTPDISALYEKYKDLKKDRTWIRCECGIEEHRPCRSCIPHTNRSKDSNANDAVDAGPGPLKRSTSAIDSQCRCFEGDVMGIIDAMGGLDTVFRALTSDTKIELTEEQRLRIDVLLSVEGLVFRKQTTWEKKDDMKCCGVSCSRVGKEVSKHANKLQKIASRRSTSNAIPAQSTLTVNKGAQHAHDSSMELSMQSPDDLGDKQLSIADYGRQTSFKPARDVRDEYEPALVYVFKEDNHFASKKVVDIVLNKWVFIFMMILYAVWMMWNRFTPADSIAYLLYTAIAKGFILIPWLFAVLLSANRTAFDLVVDDWSFWVKVIYGLGFNLFLLIYEIINSSRTGGWTKFKSFEDILGCFEIICIVLFSNQAIIFVACLDAYPQWWWGLKITASVVFASTLAVQSFYFEYLVVDSKLVTIPLCVGNSCIEPSVTELMAACLEFQLVFIAEQAYESWQNGPDRLLTISHFPFQKWVKDTPKKDQKASSKGRSADL